jgi:hypothetical protein
MTPVFTLNYLAGSCAVCNFTAICTNTTPALKSLFLLLINRYAAHRIGAGDDKTTLLCKIPTNRLLLPLISLLNPLGTTSKIL